MNNIAARRIAAQFSTIIAVLAVFISICVVAVVKNSIRRKQSATLETSSKRIEDFIQRKYHLLDFPYSKKFGDNESNQRSGNENAPGKNARNDKKFKQQIFVPYFLNYAVFDEETGEVVLTNIILSGMRHEQKENFHDSDEESSGNNARGHYQRDMSNPKESSKPPVVPKLPETNGKSKRYFIRDFFEDRDLNLLYQSRRFTGGPENRTFIIQASINMDLDFSEQLLTFLPKALAFVLVPLMLLSYGIAFLIARRSLIPVKTITNTAQKISSSNLDSRLPVSNKKDEFDSLATTFNALFERLKKDFDTEREFTGNVSHELKTPVAVISGQAKLLQRWGKDDEKQLNESLDVISKESKRMEEIVENLLQLARLENGSTEIKKENTKLLPLLTMLAEETWRFAPEAEFDFSGIPEDIEIFTDKNLFFQLLSILASNSIKFGGEKVLIQVGISEANSSSEKSDADDKNESGKDLKKVITFTDNGNGISRDISQHIFERFFRGDASHSRKAGGSGLGLSMAKEIMSVLGGKILLSERVLENSENTSCGNENFAGEFLIFF